jgi:hypothetical protein
VTAWHSVLHPRRQAAALADLQLLARDYQLTIRELTSQVQARGEQIERLQRPAVRVRVAVAGHRVLDTGYVHPATTWQGAINSNQVEGGFLTLTWVPKEPEVDQR